MNPEWKYSSVDLSDNITTIETVGCLVKGAVVTVGLSNHDCPIKDSTTSVFAIKKSAVTGDGYDVGNTRFETSLIVEPDNSATGTITVFYRKLNESDI